MSDPIHVIPKNARERVHVDFGSFSGHQYLDIRTYFLKPDGETYAPTPKGVTVRPGQIGDLILALQRAQAEAEARGLIGGAE